MHANGFKQKQSKQTWMLMNWVLELLKNLICIWNGSNLKLTHYGNTWNRDIENNFLKNVMLYEVYKSLIN